MIQHSPNKKEILEQVAVVLNTIGYNIDSIKFADKLILEKNTEDFPVKYKLVMEFR